MPFPPKPLFMHCRTYERLHGKGAAWEKAALSSMSELLEGLRDHNRSHKKGKKVG